MQWDVAIPIFLFVGLMIPIAVMSFTRTRKQESNTSGFFIGGRSLGALVLVFTLIASAASSGTFIGTPGLTYAEGYGWTWGALMQVPAAFLALGLVGKKFAILGRKLNLVTFTDVFKHRYESKLVTLLTAVCMVVFLVAYMVAQFVGGARILEAITGIPYWVLVIAFAGIVALYTGIGGFLAASYTDLVQGVIMLFGGIALWVVVLVTVGGFAGIERETRPLDPDLLVLPGASGFDIPMMISYAIMFGLLLASLPHVSVRAMAYRDSGAMHKALYVGPAIFMLFTIGFGAMGLVGRALYPEAEVPDLVIPTMIIDNVPGLLAGAILIAPLAAVMSTVSSMILVVSGAIVRDLWKDFFRPTMADKQEYRLGTGVSFGIGILVLVLALQPPDFLQHLINFAIGGLEAGLFVPLVLGLYWKRGNALAAAMSLLGGMGYYILAELFDVLSFGMMAVAPAALVSVLLYIVGSYLGSPSPRHVIVKFWGTQRAIEREVERA
jgi:sodium/pantothenate symporter